MGQDSSFGVEPGDTLETAMLSPCVGGLVRTWTNEASRLWGVSDPSTLASVMGQGVITRTLREERRFREVALLDERTRTLLLPTRTPMATSDGNLRSAAQAVQLTAPGLPTPSPWTDLKDLLGQAVRYTIEVDGFLVVERGGWDALPEPYCLFLVVHDQGEVSVVEAAPAPIGARLWEQSLTRGAAGATMSAMATDETLAAVPALMVDACATWGLEPWDLALTFGVRT